MIATRRRIKLPYPTTALELVIEILSDEDSMSRLLKKCKMYANWGFEDIYIVVPEARMALRWTNIA